MKSKKRQTGPIDEGITNSQKRPFYNRINLVASIMIPFILITLMSVGFISYVYIYRQSETLKSELIERNQLISDQVCFALKNAFYTLNWVYVQDLCKDTVEYESVLWIHILTQEGNDYLSYIDKDVKSIESFDSHSFDEKGSPDRSFGITWIDSETFSIFKPIEIGNETWYLCMGVSIRSVGEMKKRIIFDVVLISVFVIIVGCLLFVSFSRKLSNRIMKLVIATQDVAKGKLDTEIPIEVHDEIGLLVENFNEMNRSLRHYSDELKLSEKKFRTISSSAQDAIIMCDRGGIITYWNESAGKIFGYDEQEIIGKEINIIFPTKFSGAIGDTHTRIKWVDKGKTFEITAINRDKKEFPAEVSVSEVIIKWERHAVIILRDITGRKESEKKLKEYQEELEQMVERRTQDLRKTVRDLKDMQSKLVQSEKLASIGQLAAGVAHEINNPMGFITSNLGTLKSYIEKFIKFMDAQSEMIHSAGSIQANEYTEQKYKSLKIDFIKKDVKDLIEESLEGADRVKKIVQDLKLFSRVDNKEFQDTDINECIESTLNIAWNEIKYKAEVKKNLGEIPITKCYPQQINQVLMNLLINAAQSIDKYGVIEIATWNSNGHINISISDTGCGIPEQNMNRLFEPFYTTKEVGKGTGLGLSISYDIIKKHKGDISVMSKVGQGTTFTVSIPLAEDAP